MGTNAHVRSAGSYFRVEQEAFVEANVKVVTSARIVCIH